MEGKEVQVQVVKTDWGYQLTMNSQERLDLIQIVRLAQRKRTNSLSMPEYETANKVLITLGVGV